MTGKTMRHLITLACLVAAIFLYYLGLETGAALAMVACWAFEIVFWKRVLTRRPKLRT
jgi:hypothetical protein